LLINLFIKPCFRVDILLWRLNFFNSSFFARQYINEGKILINSKRVKGNYFLKKGDVISFKSESIDLFLKFLSLKPNSQIYTFVEFDNYLKRIVLIKDLKEFSNEDLNLMVKNFFDTNKLKDYIIK
jgi:ribosomal protein S4